MKLIFMGTPEFAVPVLQQLIADGYEIPGVFTQPDRPAGRGHKFHAPPVKVLASSREIPVHQPEKIKKNEEVRRVFEEARPDAAVVAAYGKILPEWLLSIPRLGCINVHSSLLPKYRGAAPINWAIVHGETVTGVTIMQMDAGMDTGPTWAQREMEIGPGENAIELTERLSRIGAELLSETLPKIENGSIRAVPQDENLASYAPMLKREDGLIDWAQPAIGIANRVRGFQPWPGAYTIFRGRRLIVWLAEPMARDPDVTFEGVEGGQTRPGSVLSIDKEGLTVLCGNGTGLRLQEVQVEGKRRVGARDFANGVHLSTAGRISD
ncbi:MAG TPA: methionyl-tRNA formyltransferase [Blastocatellia bacterium]|nr:methionyl-tRNA formyltransferase [Blastocatellia bacterium]